MALVNFSVLNIVNNVCNFFTEITDIPSCKDPTINNRMRELMIQNPKINIIIMNILTEVLKSMKTNPKYDHFDLEVFDSLNELSAEMACGWFNYDKYTRQYSELEIGDLVYTKIQEAISIESERLAFQTQNIPLENLLETLRISF
jgi:hypothetical protein